MEQCRVREGGEMGNIWKVICRLKYTGSVKEYFSP